MCQWKRLCQKQSASTKEKILLGKICNIYIYIIFFWLLSKRMKQNFLGSKFIMYMYIFEQTPPLPYPWNVVPHASLGRKSLIVQVLYINRIWPIRSWEIEYLARTLHTLFTREFQKTLSRQKKYISYMCLVMIVFLKVSSLYYKIEIFKRKRECMRYKDFFLMDR